MGIFGSLPADVRWGSFVTHSFLPHGPWGRNECVTNEPQRMSAGRLNFWCNVSWFLVWFGRSLRWAQVSWQSCPWSLKLMTFFWVLSNFVLFGVRSTEPVLTYFFSFFLTLSWGLLDSSSFYKSSLPCRLSLGFFTRCGGLHDEPKERLHGRLL